MSAPNPLAMPKRKPLPAAPEHKVLAVIEPGDPGKRVTLGHRDTIVSLGEHDGVVKTKHLQRGQRVRSWLKGEPRGGERVVDTVTKIEDGELWRVTFATPHPAQDYKAAYRWFDESLVGSEVQAIRQVPAFVPAHS